MKNKTKEFRTEMQMKRTNYAGFKVIYPPVLTLSPMQIARAIDAKFQGMDLKRIQRGYGDTIKLDVREVVPGMPRKEWYLCNISFSDQVPAF